MFSILGNQNYFFGKSQLIQANPQIGSLIALVLQQATTMRAELTYADFCNLLRDSKIDIHLDLHVHFPLFQDWHRNLRQQLQELVENFNLSTEHFFKKKDKFSLKDLKQIVIQQCSFDSKNATFTINALYHFLADAPNPLAALNLTLIFTRDGNCRPGIMYFSRGITLRNFYWSYADTRTAIEILYDAVPVTSLMERETLLQDLYFDSIQLLVGITKQNNVDDFTWSLRQNGLPLRESIAKIFDGIRQQLEEKFKFLLPQSIGNNNIK